MPSLQLSKEVLEERNKIAEKNNALKEEGNGLLRQILSKHTKHYKALLKQQEILINHQKNTKNLLKALSHGASGAVRPGAVGSVASGSGSRR